MNLKIYWMMSLSFLAACHESREYMDYGSCVKSHDEVRYEMVPAAAGPGGIPVGSGMNLTYHIETICDAYKYPDGHGPNYRPARVEK